MALTKVIVATPCMPFGKSALSDPAASTEAIKSTIQFLDHGARGFTCAYPGPKTTTLRLDAKLFAA